MMGILERVGNGSVGACFSGVWYEMADAIYSLHALETVENGSTMV